MQCTILLTILFSLPLFTLAQQDDNRTVRIPVVFHVLYSDTDEDNGINTNTRASGNSSTNIPTFKLLAELKDLHDDFMLLNKDTSFVDPYFKNIIGNPKLDFYLADEIFQAGGEKGIIRINTKNNKCKMYNTSEPIDPLKYLNIYIGRLKSNCTPFAGHPDGITNVPVDSFAHRYDGINLSYKWVGQGYRLLTHEAGHWAGLFHIFEGGCKSRTGDGVYDTPPQSGETGLETCPEKGSTDLSCNKSMPYNFNNYMDYSACRYMFTIEQAELIRKTIREKRPRIWATSLSIQ